MIKLSAPWDEYYRKVEAMFKYDNEVHVVYYPEEYKIKVYVENQAKAEVLSLMLKPDVIFGEIALLIEVVPPNTILRSAGEAYEEAFKNNVAVEEVRVSTGVFKATYIIFNKEVVQYFNDNMGSLYGLKSTLYEDIAREIFNDIPGVFYCTDYKKNIKYVADYGHNDYKKNIKYVDDYGHNDYKKYIKKTGDIS